MENEGDLSDEIDSIATFDEKASISTAFITYSLLHTNRKERNLDLRSLDLLPQPQKNETAKTPATKFYRIKH